MTTTDTRFNGALAHLDELQRRYIEATEELSERCREIQVMNNLWQEELERCNMLVEALEAVKNCIDTDYIETETDHGEIECWVSNNQVQDICDEALAALKEV